MISQFIVKMKNICNLIGSNSVHISDIFKRKYINGMWTQESEEGYTKHLNLY